MIDVYTTFDTSNMPPDGTQIALTRVTVWIDFRDYLMKTTKEPHKGTLEHQVFFRINSCTGTRKGKSKRSGGLVSHRQIGVPTIESWIPGTRASSAIFYSVWVIDSEVEVAIQIAKDELKSELHVIQVRLANISFNVEVEVI